MSAPVSSPVSALDSLLADPCIGGMIAAAPSLAARAAAARTERATLVKAIAAASIASVGVASADPVGAPSIGGAAPIARVPFVHEVPYSDPTYTAPDRFLLTLKTHAVEGIPVLLVGPAGTGKTEAVIRIAADLSRPFIKFDCGAVRDSIDWFGSPTLIGGRFGWQDSTLVDAFATEGAIILLDELNRASTQSINGLLGLLDGTRLVRFPQRAEPVIRANNVMIFATANMGIDFVGTASLDLAIRDRFTSVPTDYLDAKAEARLLAVRVPSIAAATANALTLIAAYTRTAAWCNAGGTAISTRKLLDCARMAAAFARTNAPESLAVHALCTHQSDESMGGSSASPRAQLAAYVARSFPSFA